LRSVPKIYIERRPNLLSQDINRNQAGSNIPKVAILVETFNSWGRGIIQGIANYERAHNPWHFFIDPHSGVEEDVRMPEGWKGEGVIAPVRSRRLTEQLKQLNVPVVNVSGVQISGVDFPRVTNDPIAVVRMAVNHLFKGCGLKNIAFCGDPNRKFLDFWEKSFRVVMSEYDIVPFIYSPSKGITLRSGVAAKQQDLHRWIKELPRPVGILGWDTELCCKLAQACDTIGLRVPDDVAIISMETEDLLGEIVHPPISGITLALERVGYVAAALLDRMMKKPLSAPETILIPPLYVTARQSTSVYAVEDPRLREALGWIRDHACQGATINDLLKQITVSRRVLERLFKKVFDTTPAAEISRHRIEKIKELLVKTNMAIPEVAAACGFTYVESMITFFRKKEGVSPLAYRKEMHIR
jgi:LacI family transcriptional regulator